VFVSQVKGQKKFIGILKNYKDQTVTLSNDSCELIVELDKIKKINLFPEL
ncbi:hypothetical protein KKA14_18230, partial [bacterium]|nr:hypothetical protein [bacterium]